MRKNLTNYAGAVRSWSINNLALEGSLQANKNAAKRLFTLLEQTAKDGLMLLSCEGALQH